MKKKGLFYSLDKNIFNKINTFKSSHIYGHYHEFIETLSDIQQKYVNMAVSYFFILIPILIAFYLFLGNTNKRFELNKKKEILEEINIFNSTNTKITVLKRDLVNTLSIKDKSSLENAISNIAGQIPINTGNISVLSFNVVKTIDDLSQLKGQVSFKNFSTKQLSSFLSSLIQKKINIETIDIKKSQENNSLQGIINLIYFGSK